MQQFSLRLIFFCIVSLGTVSGTVTSVSRLKKLYPANEDLVETVKYYDLSYPLNEDTIFYPGVKEYELSKDVETDQYAAYSFCMGEHGGTHLDAPFHFYKDGWHVDEIPSSHLIDVPTAVLDLENEVNMLPNPGEFKLLPSHIMHFEKQGSYIPERGIVLIHTGWSKYWDNKEKYLGWDNSTSEDKEFTLTFPGISTEAMNYLVKRRNVVGIGIDTPSIDAGTTDSTYPSHVIGSEHQVYNIENVANLHLLVQKNERNVRKCYRWRLFVLPLKITGGTGSPARILAYCE